MKMVAWYRELVEELWRGGGRTMEGAQWNHLKNGFGV